MLSLLQVMYALLVVMLKTTAAKSCTGQGDRCGGACTTVDSNKTVDDIGCTFDSQTEGLCGWTPANMQSTGMYTTGSGLTVQSLNSTGRFMFVLNPENESTLTSKLTGPTQRGTDCLEFAYLLNDLHTKLTVYIQPEGRPEMLIWSFTSNTDTDTPKWQFASVPVQQCVAFQVVLKSAATDASHAVIAIDNIKFSRDGLCSTPADEAEDSANVGAIAGAVTAVLIVVFIAVLVVGIFVWKRRSRRNASQKEDTTKGPNMESPYEQPKDAYDYAEVGDSQIPHPSATVDSGYADVMLAPSHSRTPANSRDIVHNVAPGRRDNQNCEEYDVLDLHGKGGKQQKPLEINSGEDLYHHINTQPTNQTKERTVTEVYATVQKKTEEPVTQEDVEQAVEKATDEPSGVRFAAGAVACEVSADSAGDKTLDIEDGRQGSESEVVSFAGAN